MKYGFKDTDIIADYSGGNKFMAAGLTLGCGDPSRRLEYIISEYDQV